MYHCHVNITESRKRSPSLLLTAWHSIFQDVPFNLPPQSDGGWSSILDNKAPIWVRKECLLVAPVYSLSGGSVGEQCGLRVGPQPADGTEDLSGTNWSSETRM